MSTNVSHFRSKPWFKVNVILSNFKTRYIDTLSVLAVSLQPVFSLSDTSIQMNPRGLWGRRGFEVENLRRALGADRLIGFVFPAIAGVED